MFPSVVHLYVIVYFITQVFVGNGRIEILYNIETHSRLLQYLQLCTTKHIANGVDETSDNDIYASTLSSATVLSFSSEGLIFPCEPHDKSL